MSTEHEAIRAFVEKAPGAPETLPWPPLTLAVITYQRPVTAPESGDSRRAGRGRAQTLLDRKLITTRRAPSHGWQAEYYKTTKDFLIAGSD